MYGLSNRPTSQKCVNDEKLIVAEYIKRHRLNFERWKIIGTAIADGDPVLIEAPIAPEEYYCVQYRGGGKYFKYEAEMWCDIFDRWNLLKTDCYPVCQPNGKPM